LILTGDSSKEILATLISRCQVVPFASLSNADTAAILVAHGVAPGSAPLLARLSEGSPGKALLFQNAEMVTIWQEAVKVLSDPGVDPDRDVGTLLRLADSVAALKEDLPAFLALLKIWVRDLLLGEGTFIDTLQGGDSRRKSWSSEQLFAKLRAIESAEMELARNCNRNLVCEVMLFRLQ
jgi:DNA polymerase III subunit delta'